VWGQIWARHCFWTLLFHLGRQVKGLKLLIVNLILLSILVHQPGNEHLRKSDLDARSLLCHHAITSMTSAPTAVMPFSCRLHQELLCGGRLMLLIFLVSSPVAFRSSTVRSHFVFNFDKTCWWIYYWERYLDGAYMPLKQTETDAPEWTQSFMK